MLPRSGLAARHGIALVNAPGLIDAGYRGELRVLLLNTDRETRSRSPPGDRIAQLLLAPFADARPVEAAELGASARGEGGFGSSGAQLSPQASSGRISRSEANFVARPGCTRHRRPRVCDRRRLRPAAGSSAADAPDLALLVDRLCEHDQAGLELVVEAKLLLDAVDEHADRLLRARAAGARGARRASPRSPSRRARDRSAAAARDGIASGSQPASSASIESGSSGPAKR